MIILIGSAAHAHYGLPRKVNDTDLIAPQYWCEKRGLQQSRKGKYKGKLGGKPLEVETYEWESNMILYEMSRMNEWWEEQGFDIDNVHGIDVIVPPANILYLMKKAHLNHSIKWSKHIRDFAHLEQYTKYPGETKEEQEFFRLRRKEANERFGDKSKINLNMDNDKFFGMSEKAINRKLPHDRIHEIIAYEEIPMHCQMKTDQTKAMLDKDLIAKATQDQLDKLAREEIMAIAIERFMLNDDNAHPYSCYSRAYELLTTRLSKGWFADYLIDNYPRLRRPDVDLGNLASVVKEEASHIGEMV